VPAAGLETRAWLHTVGRVGPERWVWAVSALGWLVLAAPLWTPVPGGWQHHSGMSDSGMQMPMHETTSGVDGMSWWPELGGHLVMWSAMVLAIMLPLVAWNLRQVGLRSPRGRRTRATVEVAAGWAAVWLGAGAVVSVAAVAEMRAASPALLVAASAAVTIGWQFTRVRQVALARCHRTFAPPLGRAARRGCVRFGGSLGRDCLVSCWTGMVMMTAANHQLFVVLPIAWLSWRDRRRPHDRPGTAVSVPVVVLAGLLAVVLPGSW
jgi:predicted metal-binding membrane protein